MLWMSHESDAAQRMFNIGGEVWSFVPKGDESSFWKNCLTKLNSKGPLMVVTSLIDAPFSSKFS